MPLSMTGLGGGAASLNRHSGGGFAGWNNTNGHQISLYTYQDRLYFEWWSGSAYNHVKTEPGAGIVVGSWQHVAVAYSGGTVKVYIDGSEVLSSAATLP